MSSIVLVLFGPSSNPSLIYCHLTTFVPSTYPLIPSLVSLGLSSKSWGGKADTDTNWDCAADVTGKSSLESCRTRNYCSSIWLRVATNTVVMVLVQWCSPELEEVFACHYGSNLGISEEAAHTNRGGIPLSSTVCIAKAGLENYVLLLGHHFESTSTLSGDGKISTEIWPFFFCL